MNKATEHWSPRTAGAARAAGVDIADPERRLPEAALVWLRGAAGRALELLGAAGEVGVRVIGDGAMGTAHERYAGVAGTTDVLTFDLSEAHKRDASAAGPLDVDILVCFDEAARQAGRRGHGVERELLLYIVHGVLHCMGHDDHEEGAAARMHAEEDRVLGVLGVGATYAREASMDAEGTRSAPTSEKWATQDQGGAS